MTKNEERATEQVHRQGSGKRAKRQALSLTRLSPSEIARRAERQRPGIACADVATDPATPEDTARETAEQPAVIDDVPGDSLMTRRERSEVEPGITDARAGAGTSAVLAGLGPRQMTIWEDADDPAVIAGWVAATTREGRSATDVDSAAEAGTCAHQPSAHRRDTNDLEDRDARRAHLQNLWTRDDQYLVAKVRPAIIDLVLEHRHLSKEADRRLTALGIRFGVWTLSRTANGDFDPFRDLTDARISAFVRAAGDHLGDGTRDTYAAALRRLAAGPTHRHTGKRRKAVPPLSPMIEDGLWAAAHAFTPTSWQHQETKTLLSLTFGAGALPAEITLVAPEDVHVSVSDEGLRVVVHLTRSDTCERGVPVVVGRYARWLAARSAQLSGQTYLFKPDRRDRRNAINAATRALARQNIAFERFELNAARNTWAVNALGAGVPFAEWADAAGVAPGTHLPTDLLAYLPTPDRAQVEAAFDRAACRLDRDATNEC